MKSILHYNFTTSRAQKFFGEEEFDSFDAAMSRYSELILPFMAEGLIEDRSRIEGPTPWFAPKPASRRNYFKK